MSLVNEALKSIQKKNIRKSAQIIPIPVGLLQAKRHKMILRKIVLSLVFAAIFFGMFITLLKILSSYYDAKSIQMLSPTVILNQKTSLLSQNDPYLKPVQIKGVSVNVKDNITEISVSLSQEAYYYLSTDALSNTVNILFDNTEFVATIPDLAALNAAVSNIDVKNQGKRSLLSMTLLPKSTLQHLQFSEEKKYPEMIITIDNNNAKNATIYNGVSESRQHNPMVKVVHVNTIAQRYESAMQEMEKNDLQTTLDKLKNILIDEPFYREARVSYAALLIENKQLTEANNVLLRGLSMHENYIPYIELQARILMLQDRSELALELMADYSPPMINHQRYYEQMALIYQNTNQHKEAINLYKNLLSIDDARFEWWIGLGASLEKINAVNEAEMAYKKALTLNTSNASMSKYLQNRLLTLGERHASTH